MSKASVNAYLFSLQAPSFPPSLLPSFPPLHLTERSLQEKVALRDDFHRCLLFVGARVKKRCLVGSHLTFSNIPSFCVAAKSCQEPKGHTVSRVFDPSQVGAGGRAMGNTHDERPFLQASLVPIGCGCQNRFGIPFWLVNSPPILEPILVVGLGCLLGVLCPMAH